MLLEELRKTRVATENQGEGTHHFQSILVIACPYQHLPMQEIADMFETDCLTVHAIKDYYPHVCREDHFDHGTHIAQLMELEEVGRRTTTVSSIKVYARYLPSQLMLPSLSYGSRAQQPAARILHETAVALRVCRRPLLMA